MASIGDKLREAREKRGLLWEKAHKDTKIHPNILKALEEDKGDEFLSPVYIKGFLKKYAQYLGLDSQQIVEEYESLHLPQRAQAGSPPPILTLEDKKKEPKVNYRRLLSLFKALLIIILTILFVGYLRFVLRSLSPTPPGEVTREAVKAVPSPSLLVAKDKPLILTVRAERDSWMQVKSDGRVIFENVLSRGKEEKWIAKERIELWVGNAEGLELILNGNSLGSPGKGVIKGILITREGMKVK